MNVTAANVADACMRTGVAFRLAPPSIRPLFPAVVSGRVLPVHHAGSVDAFFEAMDGASPGDVLVIDNEDRRDEACIGDLTVLEGQAFGIAAFIVWGAHRDSAELIRIGVPVFSTGFCPAGPRSLRPRRSDCRVGDSVVTRDDYIFADDDGVLFFPHASSAGVLRVAASINETERKQADAVRAGRTMHEQFAWPRYIEEKRRNPEYTLRQHLTTIGGAIEV